MNIFEWQQHNSIIFSIYSFRDKIRHIGILEKNKEKEQ